MLIQRKQKFIYNYKEDENLCDIIMSLYNNNIIMSLYNNNIIMSLFQNFAMLVYKITISLNH